MDIRLVCVTFLSFGVMVYWFGKYVQYESVTYTCCRVVFKITKLLLYFLQEFSSEIDTLSYLKIANFEKLISF